MYFQVKYAWTNSGRDQIKTIKGKYPLRSERMRNDQIAINRYNILSQNRRLCYATSQQVSIDEDEINLVSQKANRQSGSKIFLQLISVQIADPKHYVNATVNLFCKVYYLSDTILNIAKVIIRNKNTQDLFQMLVHRLHAIRFSVFEEWSNGLQAPIREKLTRLNT